MELPPLELKARLVGVLERFDELETLPQQLERSGVEGATQTLSWSLDARLKEIQPPQDGWHAWRQLRGVVDRRSADFYARTFRLFRHVPCIVMGDKMDRRNRIESRLVLSDMTAGEQAFANLIDHYLNKAPSPEYRQLTLETLAVLSSFFDHNATLQLTDSLYLDAMIGHGVRLCYLEQFPERRASYDSHKAEAWSVFYGSAPHETARALLLGLQHLLFADESHRI
jgi:phosphorylase kinase alpha/beta subunit